MVAFIDTARDATFINIHATYDQFDTENPDVDDDPQVRLSPAVRYDNAFLQFRQEISLNAQQTACAGVLMGGTEEREEHTLYRIRAHLQCTYKFALSLCIAPGPSSPSGAATGNVITSHVHLDGHGAEHATQGTGRPLDADQLIAVKNFDGSFDDNAPLCVFVMVVNLSATATGQVEGYLAVQRLVGPSPRFLDRRIT